MRSGSRAMVKRKRPSAGPKAMKVHPKKTASVMAPGRGRGTGTGPGGSARPGPAAPSPLPALPGATYVTCRLRAPPPPPPEAARGGGAGLRRVMAGRGLRRGLASITGGERGSVTGGHGLNRGGQACHGVGPGPDTAGHGLHWGAQACHGGARLVLGGLRLHGGARPVLRGPRPSWRGTACTVGLRPVAAGAWACHGRAQLALRGLGLSQGGPWACHGGVWCALEASGISQGALVLWQGAQPALWGMWWSVLRVGGLRPITEGNLVLTWVGTDCTVGLKPVTGET